jgi:hypothetical protein
MKSGDRYGVASPEESRIGLAGQGIRTLDFDLGKVPGADGSDVFPRETGAHVSLDASPQPRPPGKRGVWRGDLRDRVFARIDTSGGPDACHPWLGALARGYGVISVDNRMVKVMRLVLTWAKGEAPEMPGKHGACACHSCDNPACCNAAHLRWDSQLANQREKAERGRASRRFGPVKTHCKQGHPRSGANLYVSPAGHAQCRACVALAQSRRHLRLRAERLASSSRQSPTTAAVAPQRASR